MNKLRELINGLGVDMTEERCKQIMEQLGMPNSKSLMIALFQVANETEQEVKKKLTSDNSDYTASPKLPSLKDVCNKVDTLEIKPMHVLQVWTEIKKLGNFA